ncbi:MAG: prevent-host-death protein [Verrucomicrobia bacterium]|nr:prevent-host-death protein [Verrucomicrobiota bacterium]
MHVPHNVLRLVLQVGAQEETMETATIREVQHNLAAYVRKVEHGAEIQIRRRNQVVAFLVPAGKSHLQGRKVNWEDLREWRRKMWGGKPLPGKPLSEIVYESRGDR